MFLVSIPHIVHSRPISIQFLAFWVSPIVPDFMGPWAHGPMGPLGPVGPGPGAQGPGPRAQGPMGPRAQEPKVPWDVTERYRGYCRTLQNVTGHYKKHLEATQSFHQLLPNNIKF